MKDEYLVLADTGQGSYKEKGSKFLAFAFPVREEEEIALRLQELAIEYYDARHHCYAWRLGPDGLRYRAADAGEPNHSAGTPILNEMRSRQVSDSLVVVVRYFGGTKLGIPGLIEAYGAAAAEALDAAPKTTRILTKHLEIHFTYSQTSEVERAMQKWGLKPVDARYGIDRSLSFEVRLRDHEAVLQVFGEMGILTEV